MIKPLPLLTILGVFLSSHQLMSQGQVLSLDGVDDYVDLGPDAGNGVRTIELWFKPGSQIDSTLPELTPLLQRSPVACGTCHSVSLTFVPTGGANAGKLSCGIRNEDGTVNNTAASNQNAWNAGEWYHCACVLHPTEGMSLYINGVRQDDINPAGVNATTTDTNITALGRWGSHNMRYFDGRLDEVRLSYSPRYDTTFTPPCPGDLVADGSTIGLWYMEEGSGSSTADSSGNGYDAHIHGATWVVDTICLSTQAVSRVDLKQLMLYPNPAGTYVMVADPGRADDYVILDALGRPVRRDQIPSDDRIDISGLIPGYYLLVVGPRSAGLLVTR